MKLLFYHANEFANNANDTRRIFLSLSSLYLKTYIDINYSVIANQLEWLLPLQTKKTDQELIDYINQLKPDVLCTGHYLWNDTFILNQLERIRPLLDKDIIIIAGGPSVNVNIDPLYFKKFPFINYAVYGAGEEGFVTAIDSIINKKKLSILSASNLAWPDKESNTVVSAFKYVPQSKISPFLFNKEFFLNIVKHEQAAGFKIILPYELTRGCPYSCTFCDWNSGLSNKVTRRKDTYKDEVDLFQELNIYDLYLADANVGQYQEDVDLVQYLAEKNINENTKFKVDGNYSKLKKENNLKIYHWLGKGNLIDEKQGFTISVQDVNNTVLENISRPDVGWDVHVNMIRELKQHYPNKFSKVQLIQGLPGQTLESWRATLKTVATEEITLTPFISELLPASPAALDTEYQEKFKFEYSNAERIGLDGNFYRSTFTKSCFSFTQEDFVDMTLLTTIYTALIDIRANTDYINAINSSVIEDLVDKFLQSDIYIKLKNNLYNNWINDDKFYYTIGYTGNVVTLSADQIGLTASTWVSDRIAFSKFLMSEIKDSNFIKERLSKKFHNNPWYTPQ